MNRIVNNGKPQVGFDEHMLAVSNVNQTIFPEYKDHIDETIITTYLNLSENIIRLSGNKHLTKETINQIKENWRPFFNGTLYPGGQDVFFAWSFKTGMNQIILKPYYKKELMALILHYLTTEDLGNILTCTINQKLITVKIPPVIGLATITTEANLVPVLITLESVGEPIMKYPQIIRLLGEVTKKIAPKGIILDLYPSNWRFHPSKSGVVVEYIDIINSNKLSNIKERIEALLFNLT